MPDRFLREGFLRSAALQNLDVDARDFYVRLLLLVDDFGCYDGRPAVIVTAAYPTRYGDELPDAEAMLQTLHTADLIVRYSNRGRPFIAITQWRCGIRSRRLFPAPPVDVDLDDGSTVRGPYGREIIWQNPPGSDAVSILLDHEGRAAVPQPPEWRPANHCRPVTRRSDKTGQQGLAPVTGDQALSTAVPTRSPMTGVHVVVVDTVTDKDTVTQPEVPKPAVTANQSLPANGEMIDFNGEEFIGLSEERRIRWQGMVEFPVPDQIERAAAWLAANAGEREAIRKRGEGFESFIVRWLLREARPKH